MKIADKFSLILLTVAPVKPFSIISSNTCFNFIPSAAAIFSAFSLRVPLPARTQKEVLFQINYRTDLTTVNVVRYNGTLYNITRIDTFEGYKEDLTLYCIARK